MGVIPPVVGQKATPVGALLRGEPQIGPQAFEVGIRLPIRGAVNRVAQNILDARQGIGLPIPAADTFLEKPLGDAAQRLQLPIGLVDGLYRADLRRVGL